MEDGRWDEMDEEEEQEKKKAGPLFPALAFDQRSDQTILDKKKPLAQELKKNHTIFADRNESSTPTRFVQTNASSVGSLSLYPFQSIVSTQLKAPCGSADIFGRDRLLSSRAVLAALQQCDCETVPLKNAVLFASMHAFFTFTPFKYTAGVNPEDNHSHR